MQIHNIKLNHHFCDAIYDGEKCFEIRRNDRGYQKGYVINFQAVDDIGLSMPHPVNGKQFVITYLLHGFGIQDGYCVFGIKPKDEVSE